MIKLPEKVRVGFIDYEIVAQKGKHRRHGQCDRDNFIIEIDVNMNSRNVADTLMHEILHACANFGVYLEIKNPNEEMTVVHFSEMLSQVMRDNPDVMRWIIDIQSDG